MSKGLYEVAMKHLSQDDLPYDSPVDDSDAFLNRQSFIRRETDRILSYYENHASAGPDSETENDPRHFHKPSSDTSLSSSSSEYSIDNTSSSSASEGYLRGKGRREPVAFGPGEGHTTSGVISVSGSNRRHITVMEMDPGAPPVHHRGGDTGPAGTRQVMSSITPVASPEPSWTSNTNFAPPSLVSAAAGTIDHPRDLHHGRSASDIAPRAKSLRREHSRDVGIVGTDKRLFQHSRSRSNNPLHYQRKGSTAPIFQTPSKPSLSTKPEFFTPSSSPCPSVNDLMTPELLDKKEMGVVVADAAGSWSTTMNASPTMFSPSVPASYLHYQPGVHSTAGPPPPPIQRLLDAGPSVPPPRPPRMSPTVSISSRTSDQATTKESLKLPSHVSAVLESRLPSSSSHSSSGQVEPQTAGTTIKEASKEVTEGDVSSDTRPALRSSRRMHTREGAFPPSISGPISPPTSPQSSTLNGSIISTASSDEAKPPPVTQDGLNLPKEVEVESSLSGHSNDEPDGSVQSALDMHRRFSWVNLKIAVELAVDAGPVDDAYPTSPTKESISSLKAAVTNLKRFAALPRTPSLASVILLSVGTKTSRTQSPSLPPIPIRPKLISPWPAAMQFNDVIAHRTALDRSIGYANKINELAIYDCGLGEWMMATKHRGITRRPPSRPSSLISASQASSLPHKRLPRQRSHGSMASEATFPTRADAYTATDLTPRSEDDLPTATPPLPYPSLAQGSRITARNSLISPPTTSRSLPIPLSVSKSAGFFSSLGRKVSTSTRRDRNSPSPGKLLSRREQPNQNPRPVQLTNTPVVPGGPRAPPGRSQSITAAIPSLVEDPAKGLHNKRSSIANRPSFYPLRGSDPTPVSAPRTSDEFNDQLEKLVILLPHANKDTLAGYLRRSGQDILAVGRYLEDEKNGTIMHG